MTPEEKARQKIDGMFADAGWDVIDREEYSAGMTAAAIREGLLEGNKKADYFLFLNGKAVGVLEAKREEVDVTDDWVSEQAEGYARSVPACYPTFSKPLPIVMKSNGKELYMRDMRVAGSQYEPLSKMPTPKKIVAMLGIDDPFAGLPGVPKKGLRDCQFTAITNLEASFRIGQKKALMILATGAGKTYTACMAAYRMLAYVGMKRVLFLVDRNNLGKQAEGEFATFRLTQNGDAFNTIYGVTRLKNNEIPADSNVIISTIQRLFAFLKGEPIVDDSDEESTENGPHEVILPDNPNLPHDYFDLIVIDECHRSIYGNWKKVLDYFDTARLVGLTATPVPETLAFFNNNVVVNYSLEQSILDGVNVGHRVYSIKTEATTGGGAIRKGDKLRKETRYTGVVEIVENKETSTYTKEELNRSIVNPAQIKLVLETFRDSVYTDMFTEREPNMDYIPKTLIFALNEAHASNIVRIAKEVFGRDDDKFIQKITYSCGDSNKLIKSFRNDKDFRIAVTCTLVATGTDVKPLEVVMFMRDVASLPLYIQMKGRGVRTIGDEALRIIYNSEGQPITYAMLQDLKHKLESANSSFRPGALWNSYAVLRPDKVKRYANSSEREALTNIIQLARYAFRQIEQLESVVVTARQYFNLWMGQTQRELSPKQREIISQVVDYIASNGACSIDDIKDDDKTRAAQLIKAFGSKENANAALNSLFNFIVFRKTAA